MAGTRTKAAEAIKAGVVKVEVTKAVATKEAVPKAAAVTGFVNQFMMFKKALPQGAPFLRFAV
jgi:hypothetical protein